MKSIKSIFLMLISMIIFSFFELEVNASNSFSGLETKITIESNIAKIKKMQLALKDFGLYKGEIDGIYKNVEKSLLDYQKKTGLIKNDGDYGAGYFGIQTLTALKEDFPQTFPEISERYLKMDKPSTNIRKFVISAYYSAIPGQERYSYSSKLGRYRNYYEAIQMQGKGIKGASGKKVHVGMLAAPRNYQFGTKIEFEGLGVGIVEDRGQAIVVSGTFKNNLNTRFEYDRIDIWMGYGDEGRLRAEKWGVRTIEGKVVPNTRSITMAFDTSVVTQYRNLTVDAENPKKENVEKLQKLLTDVNIYKGKIDGNFKNVKDDLIKYQVEKNIISSSHSEHAGYFGNKTYVALRKDFGGDLFKDRKNELDEDVILSKDIRDKLEKAHLRISSIITDKYGKDTLRAIKYRRDLRIVIDYQTRKTKSNLRKKQLKYLKSII